MPCQKNKKKSGPNKDYEQPGPKWANSAESKILKTVHQINKVEHQNSLSENKSQASHRYRAGERIHSTPGWAPKAWHGQSQSSRKHSVTRRPWARHFQGNAMEFLSFFFRRVLVKTCWRMKILSPSIDKLCPQPVLKHPVGHFQGVPMKF